MHGVPACSRLETEEKLGPHAIDTHTNGHAVRRTTKEHGDTPRDALFDTHQGLLVRRVKHSNAGKICRQCL